MTDIDSFEDGVQPDSQTPAIVLADPSEGIRAEVHREYAGKLALAELRIQAAKDEIDLPEGFTDYLDVSRLTDDDGQPIEDVITEILKPFQKKMKFAELQGAGYHRNPAPVFQPRPSLDARHR
ncbi:hypothetical protein ABTZ03_23990 [Kitasatospora sp. NPDC096077]|uniref:hypothetical protein n=1 Tax=Kitasatospora sp. NPDC096077 TaxID=3155544 RepID=UPI003333A29C